MSKNDYIQSNPVRAPLFLSITNIGIKAGMVINLNFLCFGVFLLINLLNFQVVCKIL
jgi:hypothetical protein